MRYINSDKNKTDGNSCCKNTTVWTWFFGIVALLAVATCVLFSFRFDKVSKTEIKGEDYYKRQALNFYRESLFRLSDGLNNADANLGKLLVSNDSAFIGKILTETDGIASAAVTDVSVLPVSQEISGNAAKYFNQLGDYCSSLAHYVADNGKLTDEQKDSLKNLRKVGKKLKTAVDGVVLGDGDVSEQAFDENGTMEIKLEDIDETTFDYPQLVYDGPFSDSIAKKTVNREVLSKDDATKALKTALSGLGKVSSVEFKAEINNNEKAHAYRFDVVLNENEYSVVTATDGTVIELVKDGEKIDSALVSSAAVYSKDDKSSDTDDDLECACCQAATDAAKALGYDVMPMWTSEPIEGRVYVNMIAKQNGLNVYTDMVKMVLDADDCTVVGVDAFAYLVNHRLRQSVSPAISAEQARGCVEKSAEIERTELCIVPDGADEKMCYEIRVKNGDERFLVYISADTGKEIEILKIIEDKLGYTVM